MSHVLVHPCFLFYDIKTQLAFLGRNKGCTCGVLSLSTSAMIGHRFLGWFTSCLVVLFSPLFLLGVLVSFTLSLPFFGNSPQSVGLGISLISVYWSLTLLALGMYPVNIA